MSGDIKFTSRDGLCPYYIDKVNGIKYFIQDRRQGSDYVYALMSQPLKKDVKRFENKEQAVEFVQEKVKGKRYAFYKDSSGMLYETIFHRFIVKENVVITRECEKPLSGDYDSYLDCLKFAKEYVRKIKAEECGQIKMF